MRHKALIFHFILLLMIINSVVAQVPSIDPSQTVNPATGEMGFSIPIATVSGNNGHDFSVNISYQAGIRSNQEATPLGLGFGYEPGGISRKTVFVPDDNHSGDYTQQKENDSEKPWWWWVSMIVLWIIAIIITIASSGSQSWSCGVMCAVSSIAVSVCIAVVNYVTFGTQDFRAGGPLTPTYQYDDDGDGILNRAYSDCPDVYIVNTPFFNGELFYDYLDKRFCLRAGNSSPKKERENTIIEYKNDCFYFILPDGTRLFFEETRDSKWFSHYYSQAWNGENSNVKIFSELHEKQNEPSPQEWCLTKVLFSDYTDGNNDDDPTNSLKNNSGSWIVFQYEKQIINARQLPLCMQGGNMTTLVSYSGDKLYETLLKKVITPNQTAEYNYVDGRADDLWFPLSSMQFYGENDEDVRNLPSAAKRCRSIADKALPVNRQVLDNIAIYSVDSKPLRKVKFNSNYALRPNSFHSYTKDNAGNFVTLPKNPNAGTLTLQSLDVYDGNNTYLSSVRFSYNSRNPNGWDEAKVQNPDSKAIDESAKFYLEEKDVWGYYYPNNSTNNENFFVENTTDFYADAWSLTNVSFPSGMEIMWQYESNRYDNFNNLNLDNARKLAIGNGGLRFGGGLRVKNVIVDPKFTKKDTLSYFYTSNPVEIEENIDLINNTTNSSGYVCAEPYNYLAATDYREEKCVGGLYTPTKVAYEQVKCVKNYNFQTHVAPYGYTVFDFTSAIEAPNLGESGENDYSWKRGLLKSKSVYDKNKILLTKEENIYEILDETELTVLDGNSRFGILNPNYFKYHPFGVIRIKEKRNISNGIVSKNVYDYFLGSDSVISEQLQHLQNYDKQIGPYIILNTYGGPTTIVQVNGSSHLTNNYGNIEDSDVLAGFGLKVSDMSIWGISDRNYLILILGQDIKFTSTQNNCDWKYGILNIGSQDATGGYATSGIFGGFGSSDFDLNNINDLVIGEISHDNKFYYHLFMNVPESVFKNKPLIGSDIPRQQYDGEMLVHTKKEILNSLPIQVDDNCNVELACAGIRNIGGTNSNDIVFVLRWTTATSESYKIYALLDINSEGNFTSIAESEIFTDDLTYDNKCLLACLIDDDSDGKMNDIVIGGNKTQHVFDASPELRKQLYKNLTVSTNGSGKNIIDFNRVDVENVYGSGNKVFLYDDAIDLLYETMSIKPLYSLFKIEGNYINFKIIDSRSVNRHDFDGLPNRTHVVRGDVEIITDNEMAYFKYPILESRNSHDITSICQTVSYKKTATENVPMDSKVTKWSMIELLNGNTKLKPVANYSWKSPMSVAGEPTNSLPNFNFSGNNSNDWFLTDSISLYDKNQIPVEIAEPNSSKTKRMFNSTILNRWKFLIASIKNAHYEECAIFTGDYDDNIISDYFDKENGWEKGGGALSSAFSFCGTYSLYVYNNYGPTKNAAFNPSLDHTFSAQILHVPDGDAISRTKYVKMAVELHSGIPVPGEVAKTAIGSWHNEITDLKDGWNLYEYTLKATDLKNHLDAGYVTSDVKYVRIWIGNDPKSNTSDPKIADVHINDIRFYPSNAIVNTTYYDSDFGLPICNVDPNNKPGIKTTYDGFGRPVLFQKYDLTKKSIEIGYLTTVEKKEYHFIGTNDEPNTPSNLSYKISYPAIELTWDCGDSDPNQLIKYKIDLESIVNGGGGFTTVTTAPSLQTTINYTFTPVNIGEGPYRCTISATDDFGCTISKYVGNIIYEQ